MLMKGSSAVGGYIDGAVLGNRIIEVTNVQDA